MIVPKCIRDQGLKDGKCVCVCVGMQVSDCVGDIVYN